MGRLFLAVIIGGAVLGVLSAIPAVNTCCMVWAIGGGALASFIYIRRSPTPVSGGTGGVTGLLTGVFGAVLFFALFFLRLSMWRLFHVSIPYGDVYGIEGFPTAIPAIGMGVTRWIYSSGLERILKPANEEGIGWYFFYLKLFNGLVGMIPLIVFACLGGIIGVSLFQKRKGAAP
jgi:hypothetical protein